MEILCDTVRSIESCLSDLESETNRKEIRIFRSHITELKILLNSHRFFFKLMEKDGEMKTNIAQLRNQLKKEKRTRIRISNCVDRYQAQMKTIGDELKKKEVENEVLRKCLNKMVQETDASINKIHSLRESKGCKDISIHPLLSNLEELRRGNDIIHQIYGGNLAENDKIVQNHIFENEVLNRKYEKLLKVVKQLEDNNEGNNVHLREEEIRRQKMEEANISLIERVTGLSQKYKTLHDQFNDLLAMKTFEHDHLKYCREPDSNPRLKLMKSDRQVADLERQVRILQIESEEKESHHEEEIKYLKGKIKSKMELNENLQKYQRFLKESYKSIYG